MNSNELRPILITDSDAFAGTERHILSLSLAFLETGIQPIICCPGNSPLAKQARQQQIEVIEAAKGGFVIKTTPMLISLLRSGRVNILHAHNGVAHAAAALAVRIANKGICVASLHLLENSRSTRKGLIKIASDTAHFFLRSTTNQFIAVSNAVASASTARGEVPLNLITTIHNGIEPISSRLEDDFSVRQGLGIGDNTPLIVTVSRLEPEKSVEVLVRAMVTVKALHTDAVCVVVGEGSERERLQTLIDELNLESHVKLVGYKQDALAIVNSAQVFVLSSAKEGFGLSLLEAMALKKPIVAIKCGGPVEILDSGQSGILVEAGDSESIGKEIAFLLANEPARTAMAEKAFLRYRTYFAAEVMARKTVALYEHLMSQNSAVF